jgi:hypothetical protein
MKPTPPLPPPDRIYNSIKLVGMSCQYPSGIWRVRPKPGFYIDHVAKDVKPKHSWYWKLIRSFRLVGFK